MKLRFLIDTGAAASAISAQIFEKLPEHIKTTLSCDTLSTLKSASGDDINVLGQVELPFLIHKKIYGFKVLVAQKLSYDIILGKDFLENYNAVIDLKANSLTLSEGVASRTKPTATTHVLDQCTLNLSEATMLPPPSETLLFAALNRPFDPGITGIIKPEVVQTQTLIQTDNDQNLVKHAASDNDIDDSKSIFEYEDICRAEKILKSDRG